MGQKIKVLLDFFQKIAVSKGSAFGRPPQRAKYPRRARREIPLAAASETPARRSGRNPQSSKAPSADGAIPGQRPWPPLPPPIGVDSGGHLLTVVRPTAPGRTRTGGGGPRPTNDDGSSYKFVGDDAHIVPAAQCRQTQRTQANAYQRTDAPRHDVRRCGVRADVPGRGVRWCGVRADVGIGPYRVCAYTNQPITRTIPLPPGLTL